MPDRSEGDQSARVEGDARHQATGLLADLTPRISSAQVRSSSESPPLVSRKASGALSGAEYGIEHATDQFDPADDQPVDVFGVQELSRPGKRCLLQH